MSEITAVVIAGGSGSRLWPLSRSTRPKQFVNVVAENSLFEGTVGRLANLDISSITVVCNEVHRFHVVQQLRDIGQPASIILEPVGKNTAPAVALSALLSNDDSLLLVLPADHVVNDEAAFVEAISSAIPLAESGKLVTFGIKAQRPHTGYGYIKAGIAIKDGFEVEEFKEKPSVKVAEEYLSSGDYYWNSGMFLFKASRYLAELKKYRRAIFDSCESAVSNVSFDLDFVRIDNQSFTACPEESIDYAVMENTQDAVVVPMKAGWSDLGSWDSLWEISAKDVNNNSIRGDVIPVNTSNCYVRTDGQLVATLGVDDLVVVVTKDSVLVANKNEAQNIKEVCNKMRELSRPELDLNREVHRPWGKYDSIDNGVRYQVKRITVYPGEKLSVQMHHHRAEHWIVVSGVAKITNGDKSFLLSENESTYIPLGVVHALENPGKINLELIEVQSGAYLGEDDIVRFDDQYGRD